MPQPNKSNIEHAHCTKRLDLSDNVGKRSTFNNCAQKTQSENFVTATKIKYLIDLESIDLVVQKLTKLKTRLPNQNF